MRWRRCAWRSTRCTKAGLPPSTTRCIANQIAYVLCGGDLSEPGWVPEQYILDLERDGVCRTVPRAENARAHRAHAAERASRCAISLNHLYPVPGWIREPPAAAGSSKENTMQSTPPTRAASPGRWISLRIAVIYVLVSGAWILFSDRLLAMLVTDPDRLTDFQTAKGWGLYAGCGGGIVWVPGSLSPAGAAGGRCAAQE